MSASVASSKQAQNWFKPGVGGNPTGRPKGTPNKIQASIKEMVEKALTKAGGVEYLTEQARKNPVAFMGLVGKVLPLQVVGHDGGRLEVEFRWKEPETPTIEATAVDTGNCIDGDDDAPSVSFIGEC